jgi:hypothetical protein
MHAETFTIATGVIAALLLPATIAVASKVNSSLRRAHDRLMFALLATLIPHIVLNWRNR